MPNLGSVLNYFATPFENSITMTLGGSIASGATTVPVNGMSNYTNGQIVVFTVDPGTPAVKQVFTGTVSGTNVVNVVWTEGTNQPHSNGASVIDYVSATTVGMMSTGIQKFSTQTGLLNPVALYDANSNETVLLPATASAVNQVSLNNAITGNPVTIAATGNDTNIGVNINGKGSGFVSLSGAGKAVKGYVATGETTASTTPVQLATTTDKAVVTIGTNGLALVSFNCYANVNSNNAIAYVSFAVSGATTIAARLPASGTVEVLMQQPSGQSGNNYTHNATALVTGLNAGSTTFSMEYAVSAGTGTFTERYISVVPL